ncbi:hypothetical protein YC2023_049804 [Brassica napus]
MSSTFLRAIVQIIPETRIQEIIQKSRNIEKGDYFRGDDDNVFFDGGSVGSQGSLTFTGEPCSLSPCSLSHV